MIIKKKVTFEELLERTKDIPSDVERRKKLYDSQIIDFALGMINEASKANRVIIVGDYDFDGVASSNILARTIMRFANQKNIETVIGDRFTSGYGVPSSVSDIAKKGDLIICTDVGSSQLSFLKELKETTGILPYVIDHHEYSNDIGYETLLNFTPLEGENLYKTKAPDYCATGVNYKIYELLSEKMPEKCIGEDFTIEFNSVKVFGCLGTVADMVRVNNPYDDNRKIIRQGFELIRNASPENIEAPLGYFLDSLGVVNDERSKSTTVKYVTTTDLGFNVCPVVNAMGRMESFGGLQAFNAFYQGVFKDKEYDFEAIGNMILVNEERKTAVRTIENSEEFKKTIREDNNPIIVYYNPDVPEGVAGLIASRITNSVDKPAICLTMGVNGNIKGSGRNADGYPSLYENCKTPYTIGFGGHEQALGLSLKPEKLEDFKKALYDNYKSVVREDVVREYLSVNDITVERLYQLEPFGTDFPAPIVSEEITATKTRVFKPVTEGSKDYYGCFYAKEKPELKFFSGQMKNDKTGIKDGDRLLVEGSLCISQYNGGVSLQVSVENTEKIKERQRENENEKEIIEW